MPAAGHAGGQDLARAAITLGKVSAFVALMLVVGRRLLPRLLLLVARTGSRELFTLCVIASAVGVAYASAALFDVSFALGAFFAGMMMRESELSHRAAAESLPLRDAFAVLFFVSVGMLFDPRIVIDEPCKLLAVVAIVMVGKPLVAMALVLALPLSAQHCAHGRREPRADRRVLLHPGRPRSVARAAARGGPKPHRGRGADLDHGQPAGVRSHAAGTGMDPQPLRAGEASGAQRRSAGASCRRAWRERYLAGQVVLVGYGRVGRRIATVTDRAGHSLVVAEQNRERVEQLRKDGIPAVSGDASQAVVLIQAHIAKAGMLVIATPDTVSVRRMAEIARTLNPAVEIVVRTHDEEEADLLRKENVGVVFFGEHELASAMTRHVLARRGLAIPEPT